MDRTESRDEYIERVTLGGAPQAGDIVLAEYDPAWPGWFRREARRIREALGDTARELHHVGSTSVPDLCAKPLLDVLLLVADSADEESYLPPLTALGYTLRVREPDWFQHRLLKGPNGDVNLHVFCCGCPEAARMLLFRDWLRRHADDRRLYADTKRALAARTWKYVQHYADAKSEVVQSILARAQAKA